MSEAALDALDQPTRVYVLACRQAQADYQRTMHEAAKVRQAAIDNAAEACEIALRSMQASAAVPDYQHPETPDV